MASSPPGLIATIEVFGSPIAQDRPRARIMGKHALVHDSGKSRPWKALVIDAAREAGVAAMRITEPIGVELIFRIKRPKSHFGTGKNSHRLKDSAPYYVTSKPDMDNLIKSVFDALTEADVWSDDSIVAEYMTTCKRYCFNGESPGCVIQIWNPEKTVGR